MWSRALGKVSGFGSLGFRDHGLGRRVLDFLDSPDPVQGLG